MSRLAIVGIGAAILVGGFLLWKRKTVAPAPGSGTKADFLAIPGIDEKEATQLEQLDVAIEYFRNRGDVAGTAQAESLTTARNAYYEAARND